MAKKKKTNNQDSMLDAYIAAMEAGDKKFGGVTSVVTIPYGFLLKPAVATLATTLSSGKALDGFLRQHSSGWAYLQNSSVLHLLTSKGNIELISKFITDFESSDYEDEEDEDTLALDELAISIIADNVVEVAKWCEDKQYPTTSVRFSLFTNNLVGLRKALSLQVEPYASKDIVLLANMNKILTEATNTLKLEGSIEGNRDRILLSDDDTLTEVEVEIKKALLAL